MPVLMVPVKPLRLAKSRLDGLLGPDERMALTLAMAEDVVAACLMQEGWDTWVVSRDRRVLRAARDWGARPVAEAAVSLTGAIRQVEAALAGDDDLAVVLADLPLITARGLGMVLRVRAAVVGVRAASDGGTNVLVRRPATAILARFGRDSFAKHEWAARREGIRLAKVDRADLAFDLDRPDDVLRLMEDPRSGRAAVACRRMRLRERLRAPA
jgi:2-phospho-L-lactate/phosphoenolpyruvate guanylyltransferase